VSLNFKRYVYITGQELPTASTHANNGARVSGDEVPKKRKQNANTVHILTSMVAIQDETIHYVATKVGDCNKTGGVPQPQAVTEPMMELGEQMSIGNL